MKLASWVLAVALLAALALEAVTFHRATVCRQRAWQRSFQLRTQGLLSEAGPGRDLDPRCQAYFEARNDLVLWGRVGERPHRFGLPLKGTL